MHSFKKILKTVGVFLLLVGVLNAFFIGCYLKGENFHYQDEAERSAHSGELELLACGASYTLFGIRPDILNAEMGIKSYDLAGTLLTLRGRWELLRQELERNPVKLVLLEVSPDTVLRDRAEEGAEGDLPMLGRITDPATRWAYFRAAFSVKEWPAVYYDLTSKGIEAALRLFTGRYERENRIMIDGYYYNTKEDMPLPDNYPNLYNAQSLPEAVLPENVEWLERLISVCREHGAQVVLITTPQSKYYNCIKSNLDYYQDWFSDFAAAHDVPYYNFNLAKSKLELLPDKGCFYDETHLNTAGGEVFTRMLAEILSRAQAGESVEEYFFASYRELDQASHYWD